MKYLNFIEIYKIKKYVKITTMFMLLFFIINLFFVFFKQDFALGIIQQFIEIQKTSKTAFDIFFHNTTISLVTIVFSFIPVLGIIPFIVEVFLFGLIFATMIFDCYYYNKNFLQLFTFQVLPHGIFEILEMIITNALSLFILVEIIKTLFKKSKYKITDLIKITIKLFFLLIIPLLIISAIIETYVTPILSKIFIN